MTKTVITFQGVRIFEFLLHDLTSTTLT